MGLTARRVTDIGEALADLMPEGPMDVGKALQMVRVEWDAGLIWPIPGELFSDVILGNGIPEPRDDPDSPFWSVVIWGCYVSWAVAVMRRMVDGAEEVR